METLAKDVVLNNIISVMKAKGMTQVDFISAVNEHLPENKQIKARTTFSDWKNGKSSSYLKILPQIAEVLEVSVSSLFEDPDGEEEVFELAGIDPEEEEILKLYRESSTETRMLILRLVKDVIQLRKSLMLSELQPDQHYTLVAKPIVSDKSEKTDKSKKPVH